MSAFGQTFTNTTQIEIFNRTKTKRFFLLGDIDDSVFIVQSGKLNVLINNADGTTVSLKHVKRGESVTSLLSFIDVLAVI